MASTRDGSDPWDWDVDRVVQELCTSNRSWQPQSAAKTLSDPGSLEQALKHHEVSGCVLLEHVDDAVMKDDLGLSVLGRRAFVRSAITELRLLSVQYQAYQRTHHPEIAASSAISRSIHDFMQRFPAPGSAPGVLAGQPQQQRLLPAPVGEPNGADLQNSLEIQFPASEETPANDRETAGNYLFTDESGNKRRKLDSPNTADELEAQFEHNIQEVAEDSPREISIPAVDPSSFDVGGKKRKRIAPTLITTVIDQNRSREILTAADNLVQYNPQGNEPAPLLQPANTSETSSNTEYQDLGFSIPEAVESSVRGLSLLKPSKGRSLPKRPSAGESSSRGYLGRRKIPVDDLFYKGTGIGEELTLIDAPREFVELRKDISTGRRLYVHGVMRNFLRAESQLIVRDGKYFSAVRPYPGKLAPRFQNASFTLFSTDEDGKIHATREEVPYWPEIDPFAGGVQAQNGGNENKAIFNPLGPGMLNTYENPDPDNLWKYEHLEGGDEVLPIYGDSDEENEYDLATWKEIEAERGELERGPVQETKKNLIGREEADEAIDEGIAELVTKWKEKTLPKREKKAFSLWKKSRAQKSYKEQITAAQQDLTHIHERIAKLREEILNEIWTSKRQVRKQIPSMEASIFTREDLAFKIATLEQKIAPEKPEKPLHTSSVAASKKSTGPSDDGEEGESIGSESDEVSSEDSMDDFVVPDDAAPTIEEERHELNLADSEDEDGEDAILSDVDMHDAPDEPPITPPQPIRLKGSKKRKDAHEKVDSDLDVYEFLTPPSANNISRPEIKDEELMLPKLPANPVQGSPELVDLTMLSSDDSPLPPVIDLITPKKKKKPVVRLINRSSPFNSSPINISDSNNEAIVRGGEMPDPANMPPYDDPAAIAKYSYKAWARSFDRERLLIKVFYTMKEKRRIAFFNFIPHMSEADAWGNMTQVIYAMTEGKGTVRGMDVPCREIIEGLIHLFVMFVDGIYHRWSETPTSEKLMKILEQKTTLFTPFYNLCYQMEGFFDHSKQRSPLTPSKPASSNASDDDEDGEPLSATRRRSRDTTTSEEEPQEQDMPHKKRKKVIFEDAKARGLREATRLRLAEQEKRRKVLQARLAKTGHASDEGRGLIIINDAAAEDQGFVFVHSHIAKSIKKHQIDGVRFMWNQIVTPGEAESMQGCLLAHTMGLGKTMQTITLLVAIAQASESLDPKISSQIPESLKVSRTLVLCPPGLINNWHDELLTWVPDDMLGTLNATKLDASLKLWDRLDTIEDWYLNGGVLIMGYQMFRMLIENKRTKSREPALTEEQHEQVQKHLLEGPNIIIADEAHKLKNASTGVTVAASQFRSKSRIALTGSPLANNVEEYHTMIEWVSKNYLGPAVEFRAKYVEPIQAGLWHDSTSEERRKSLKMLGVLKEDLAPKVHRADMSVLRNDLQMPKKVEFVITVPLTELQRKAYSTYVRLIGRTEVSLTKSGNITQTTIWHWLAVLSLLCNHPDCFNAKLQDRKQEARKEITAGASPPGTDLDDIAAQLNSDAWKVGVSPDLISEVTKLFKEEAADLKSIDLSYKAKILCQILDASKAAKDKVLVFSQSIPTLNFLEDLCIRQKRKYARLDGSTVMSKRQDMIKDFNKGNTDIYLISTTAGSLGLNLPSANRVVIFDFRWNPTMEEQAVGRAYRIGQTKPTFVYRFVAGGTFEDSIHNKTVFKMQLASRVVDKKNPIAYATKKLTDFLFEPKEVPQTDLKDFIGMDPQVLDKILEDQKNEPTIRKIVQSDTFELDDEDKLTAEEQKEVEQILSDQQLQRSDPQKYLALINKRQQQEYAARQAHVQRPPQNNTAMTNRPVSASQGLPPPLPGRQLNGSAIPSMPQPGLKAAAALSSIPASLPRAPLPAEAPAQKSKPHSSLDVNKATGPMPTKALMQPPKPAPKPGQQQISDNIQNTGQIGTPGAENSRKSTSPARGTNTKIRTPSPEDRKPSDALNKPVSAQVAKTPPDNGPKREGFGTPESRRKLARDIRYTLTEAARRTHESAGLHTDTQRADKAAQLLQGIFKFVKTSTNAEPAREKAIQTALNVLKSDTVKCQALLTSELSVEDFVRDISQPRRSTAADKPQEPSLSSSNSVNDITQSDMFLAMNRQSHHQVQSLRTPVTIPRRGAKEGPILTSSRRQEDEREIQRIEQRRQRRANRNRISTRAEDKINKARSEQRRDSLDPSRTSKSRPGN